MAKNRRSLGNQLDPAIKQGLQQANMAELQAQRIQALNAEKQEQRDLMVRMFVAEAARSLYVEAVANHQDKIEGDETFIKLADASQHAALILADRLGLINLKRTDPEHDAEADGDVSQEEETTTEGRIIIEE